MRSLRSWPCFLSVLALGCLSDAALALPHWKPKPAGPTTVYAPRVRHFIVVDPVPAAPSPLPTTGEAIAPADAAAFYSHRKGERVKKALSPAQTQTIFWQQRVEPVPAYPWGWFGARRHTSNTSHRRFYSDQFDWDLLRGD